MLVQGRVQHRDTPKRCEGNPHPAEKKSPSNAEDH